MVEIESPVAASKPFTEPGRSPTPIWLLLLAFVIGLANVNKPMHIDDTLYVKIAEHIAAHPSDPFGGIINWQHVPTPAYKISISPPGLSYYFAMLLWLPTPTVMTLHLGMIPFYLMLAWGSFRLGEEIGLRSAWLSALLVSSPAVMVGGNLMLDVPLVGLLCACLAWVMIAIRNREIQSLLWGTLAAGALALVKYPGAIVLPMLFCLAVAKRSWRPLVPMMGGAISLFAWQSFSRAHYGAGQIESARGFLEQFHGEFTRMLADRLLQMLVILAMTTPGFLLSLLLGSRRRWAAFFALPIAGLAVVFLPAGFEKEIGPTILVASLAFLGAFGLLEPMLTAWHYHKWLAVFVGIWQLGVIGMTVLGAPFVAVRYFLPMQPALLLAQFANPRIATGKITPWVFALLLVGSSILMLADHRWANVYPKIAADLAKAYPGRPISFLGHWGWQYYCERQGFFAWDARETSLGRQQILLVPLRADRTPISPSLLRSCSLLEEIEIPPPRFGVNLWNHPTKNPLPIRFYGGSYPHLPWGFTTDPVERIEVYQSP